MRTLHVSINPIAVLCITTALFVSVTAYVGASSSKPRHWTAPQIVQQIDDEIQPRFQVEAGVFGEERVRREIVRGHMGVGSDLMTDESPREKRALKPVSRAPYFIVLGIMHVRHKPGADKDTHRVDKLDRRFLPSSSTLEASGTTYNRAMRTYGWGERNIVPATKWAYERVRRGQSLNSQYGKFYVAIRPIKAMHKTCIGCHSGTHLGDTLGAMIYMVSPTANGAPATAVALNDPFHQAG